MPTGTPGTELDLVLQVRITPKIRQRLRKRAFELDRPMSVVAREMLIAGLKAKPAGKPHRPRQKPARRAKTATRSKSSRPKHRARKAVSEPVNETLVQSTASADVPA